MAANPTMYSDTLLALERAHLLQIIVWGGASILVGAALLAILAFQRVRSPLLSSFALQCIAWGFVEAVLGWIRLRGAEHRDGAGALALERLLWLNTGLDAGYATVGVTLVLTGWYLGRSGWLMGAGIGVIVHGLALLTFDLRFVLALSPHV